jgi:hypothetical protein
LYRFVWNNPASGYDPDGLQTTQPSTQPATFPCVGVGFTDTWLTGPILLDQFVSDQWPGSGGPGVITGAAKEVTFVWGRQHAQIFACCVDGALKFLWGEPSLAWQIRPVSVPLEHAFLVKAWQVSVSWHNVEIISLRSAWTPYDEDGHREMKRLAQSPQGRPAPGQWKRQLAKPPKGGRRIGSGEKFGCGYWPPHKEVRKKAGKPPKPVPWPKKLP